MATNLNVTELDFKQIKTNLKNFLKQQNEFNDYDFDDHSQAYFPHMNKENGIHVSLNLECDK